MENPAKPGELVNVVFVWVDGNSHKRENDKEVIGRLADKCGEVVYAKVKTLAEAERILDELEKSNKVGQIFHRGQPPMSIYNFLGGTRL